MALRFALLGVDFVMKVCNISKVLVLFLILLSYTNKSDNNNFQASASRCFGLWGGVEKVVPFPWQCAVECAHRCGY